MDQMQVDVEEIGFAVGPSDDVALPDLVGERARRGVRGRGHGTILARNDCMTTVRVPWQPDAQDPFTFAKHRRNTRPVPSSRMEVEIVRWPDEEERLERLRSSGHPRLLLVDDDDQPPPVVDPLEDWTRTTADPRDVQIRVSTLHRRAERDVERPVVDASGLLHFGGRWVALSPVEAALAELLVERFGAVVGRDGLARSAWREGVPTRNALDVQMVRFRRRIESLGLEVRTVRSRGYLLQPAS